MTIEEWAKDFKSYVNELQMPRDDYKGIMSYIDDAIALWKEQNAVEPKNIRKSSSYAYSGLLLGYCPKCGIKINSSDNISACGKCGQRLKWNEHRRSE